MFYRERLRLFFGLISGLEFVSRVGHGHPFVVQCKVHLYSFVYDNWVGPETFLIISWWIDYVSASGATNGHF